MPGNAGPKALFKVWVSGQVRRTTKAILAAAGYNFSLLLRWLPRLLRALIAALAVLTFKPRPA